MPAKSLSKPPSYPPPPSFAFASKGVHSVLKIYRGRPPHSWAPSFSNDEGTPTFSPPGGAAGFENQQLSRKQQALIFFLPPDPGFRNRFSNRCSGPNTEPTKPPLRNPFRRLRRWTGAGLLSAIPNRTTTGSS